MNSDFPRMITLLRKEKGLSQKAAALELGVSQALLSHYEKGIRECGLDFVVKIADYYQVSCDYLLGRSANRNGAVIKVDDIPEIQSLKGTDIQKNNMIMLNKRLVMNSINILYELIAKSGSKGLNTEMSAYMMVSVYKLIRMVYSANIRNPQAMFSVPPEMYLGFSSALQQILETNALYISIGKPTAGFSGVDSNAAPALSPESLSKQFPDFAPSLFNLIQQTEERIKKLR